MIKREPSPQNLQAAAGIPRRAAPVIRQNVLPSMPSVHEQPVEWGVDNLLWPLAAVPFGMTVQTTPELQMLALEQQFATNQIAESRSLDYLRPTRPNEDVLQQIYPQTLSQHGSSLAHYKKRLAEHEAQREARYFEAQTSEIREQCTTSKWLDENIYRELEGLTPTPHPSEELQVAGSSGANTATTDGARSLLSSNEEMSSTVVLGVCETLISESSAEAYRPLPTTDADAVLAALSQESRHGHAAVNSGPRDVPLNSPAYGRLSSTTTSSPSLQEVPTQNITPQQFDQVETTPSFELPLGVQEHIIAAQQRSHDLHSSNSPNLGFQNSTPSTPELQIYAHPLQQPSLVIAQVVPQYPQLSSNMSQQETGSPVIPIRFPGSDLAQHDEQRQHYRRAYEQRWREEAEMMLAQHQSQIAFSNVTMAQMAPTVSAQSPLQQNPNDHPQRSLYGPEAAQHLVERNSSFGDFNVWVRHYGLQNAHARELAALMEVLGWSVAQKRVEFTQQQARQQQQQGLTQSQQNRGQGQSAMSLEQQAAICQLHQQQMAMSGQQNGGQGQTLISHEQQAAIRQRQLQQVAILAQQLDIEVPMTPEQQALLYRLAEQQMRKVTEFRGSQALQMSSQDLVVLRQQYHSALQSNAVQQAQHQQARRQVQQQQQRGQPLSQRANTSSNDSSNPIDLTQAHMQTSPNRGQGVPKYLENKIPGTGFINLPTSSNGNESSRPGELILDFNDGGNIIGQGYSMIGMNRIMQVPTAPMYPPHQFGSKRQAENGGNESGSPKRAKKEGQ